MIIFLFFSGIGKTYFLKVLFENAKFIHKNDHNTLCPPVPFSHTELEEQADSTFLAFIRLVGCAYFKKHANAFLGETPESTLNSFASEDSPMDQHTQ